MARSPFIPRQAVLTTTGAIPNVQLAAGTVKFANSVIEATDLQVGAFGGLSVLNAKFDMRSTSGDLQARWNGLSLQIRSLTSGTITASLRMPFADHPAINVDLQSQGTANSGTWNARANLSGQGTSWAIDRLGFHRAAIRLERTASVATGRTHRSHHSTMADNRTHRS